jgi:hypothetical protein
MRLTGPNYKLLTLLFLLLLGGCIALPSLATAQKLKFARTFDNLGAMVGEGTEFKYQPPTVKLAVKFIARAELPIDTLFIIVKDINGVAGRFYMKRSKNKLEANALINLKADGIYRVYIYNPAKRVRPIAHGNIFVTSPNFPTKAELLERQRKVLVERGIIKDKNNPNADPFAGRDTTSSRPESNVDDEFTDADTALDEDLFGDDELGLDEFDEKEVEDSGDLLLEDDIAPEDVSGEFESYDDLDDEFEFEIDDF